MPAAPRHEAAGVASAALAVAVLGLLVMGCHNLRLDLAALGQALRPVHYNGSYYRISYPGGDVPDSVGVCTDVVIRAYRRLGVDLQKEVHEDILAAPREYGITAPDTDTDHRRVRNLRVFLRRRGASLPVTMRAADYWDGDLVTWDWPTTAGGREGHIGIVATPVLPFIKRPLICHHVAGDGPDIDDVLFDHEPTGHYRWRPRPTGE